MTTLWHLLANQKFTSVKLDTTVADARLVYQACAFTGEQQTDCILSETSLDDALTRVLKDDHPPSARRVQMWLEQGVDRSLTLSRDVPPSTFDHLDGAHRIVYLRQDTDSHYEHARRRLPIH